MRTHGLRALCLGAALLCAASLGGCASAGSGQSDLTVAGVTAAETAAALRCPRNSVELGLLLSLRVAFDISLAPTLDAVALERISELRAITDRACGISLVTAPVMSPIAGPRIEI